MSRGPNGELWRKRSTQRQRLLDRLLRRDQSRCRYCSIEVRRYNDFPPGVSVPKDAATVEHYPVPRRDLPVRFWFDHRFSILACNGCNQRCANDGVELVPIGWTPSPAEIAGWIGQQP